MPRAGTITRQGGKPVDYYEISVKQFASRSCRRAAADHGVGLRRGQRPSQRGLLMHHAPSLTIEALSTPAGAGQVDQRAGRRRRQLPAASVAGRPDAALGEPAGRHRGRDGRPTFTATPGPYTGPVPLVTHVHGAVGVGDESDGYAEAWYLPAADDIPAGFATEGTWYDFFTGKAAASSARPGARLRHLPVPEPRSGRDRPGTTTTPWA